MAVPIAPLVWTAVRIGAVASVAAYVTRKSRSAPKHIWREAALDDLQDGLEVTRQKTGEEANAHAAQRFRRTVRLGSGPGVEIDFAALARIRFRRVE